MPNNIQNIEFTIAPWPGWEAARQSFMDMARAAAGVTEATEAARDALVQRTQQAVDREIAEAVAEAPRSFEQYRQYMNSWGEWTDLLVQDEELSMPNNRTFVVDRRPPRPAPAETANAQAVTLRSVRQAAQLSRGFTMDNVHRAIQNQGYRDYTIMYEIPAPYTNSNITVAYEVLVNQNGDDETRIIMGFRLRGGELGLYSINSETEYVSELRRRAGTTDHFYKAQVEGRRKLFAQLLGGGKQQFQLLLSIADDDMLREAMSSKEFRKAMASPEMRARAATGRMAEVRRARRRTMPRPAVSTPDSDRGLRAMNAVERAGSRRRQPRQAEDRTARLRGTPFPSPITGRF